MASTKTYFSDTAANRGEWGNLAFGSVGSIEFSLLYNLCKQLKKSKYEN